MARDHDTSRAAMSDLLPPQLFQAPGGTLDLMNISSGDPVVVSVPLRDAQPKETFTVFFGDKQTPAQQVPSAHRFVIDVCFDIEDLPPLNQPCDVKYYFRGKTSPPTNVLLIDSSRGFLWQTLHESNLIGTYAPGVLDAWVVPVTYSLSNSTAVIQQIGEKLPEVNSLTLQIMRRAASKPPDNIGNIRFQKSAGEWQINFASNVTLARGDLVSIEMTGGSLGYIGFSACF